MKKGKSARFKVVLVCISFICAVTAMIVFLRPPSRVDRLHSENVPEEYQFLRKTISFSLSEPYLTQEQVEDDLDEFEWYLENCYSYLHRVDVDYKAALDAIRFSVKGRIKRSQFAWKINKLIALFGDGHSRVKDPAMKWLGKQHLPFLIEEYRGRYFAFKEDRSGFVDPGCPFITKIQGLPVSQWLQAAKESVPDASEQFVNIHSIRNTRYYGILSRELGFAPTQALQIQLESENCRNHKTLSLAFSQERPQYGSWPKTESRIINGNIGYLRLAPFMDFRQEFLDGIVQNMNDFKNTQGLIIDIRGNGGGARSPLNTLFPFFMKPDDKPHIVNIAAYRNGIGSKKGNERFGLRFLYPIASPHWKSAEKLVIKSHVELFQPEWKLPGRDFSAWHYFVISPPVNDDRYYYYDKPVVILMENWNFSACDIFLGAFKGWRNVTLLGTPSGGGSGSAISYRLHHSDIRIKLSSMASFRANGMLYDGNGIQPDIYCEPIPTDAIGQTDTLLDKAKEILREKIS
ncbi:MAG: S41 family peptidase [Planctomycetota bacterium]